jgi:hypothetical protein
MKDYFGSATGLIAALLIWVPDGYAGDFNYSYLEANWVSYDLDASARVTDTPTNTDFGVSSDDDNGFELGGSIAFSDDWHVFGEYMSADQDVKIRGTLNGVPLDTGTGFDIDRARIGVGYAWGFRKNFDLYGRLSYDWAEIDEIKAAGLSFGDNDDTGPGAEIGSHWRAWRGLELDLSLRYTDVGDVDGGGDFDSDVLAGLDARWWFNDRWGLQLVSEFGETKRLGAGVRVNF